MNPPWEWLWFGIAVLFALMFLVGMGKYTYDVWFKRESK